MSSIDFHQSPVTLQDLTDSYQDSIHLSGSPEWVISEAIAFYSYSHQA